MIKTVYIPVDKSTVTNKELMNLREIRDILEDVYDMLYKVYIKYGDFRELDILTQKVEEAILWSHRVITLEIEDEKLRQGNIDKTEVKSDKEECCNKDLYEKLYIGCNADLQGFSNKLKSTSIDSTRKPFEDYFRNDSKKLF